VLRPHRANHPFIRRNPDLAYKHLKNTSELDLIISICWRRAKLGQRRLKAAKDASERFTEQNSLFLKILTGARIRPY
jgi:hypothetical protein